MRRSKSSTLRSPYLKDISLKDDWSDFSSYPFNLPLFSKGEFKLQFERPVTIIVGENGVGKSTLLEGIAVLAGFDDAGGGNGYRPVDHSRAIEKSGGLLAKGLKAAWLPKVTNGWFFKAETFFSVARYLDEVARESGQVGPDFLSYSHGEGFLRLFQERCRRRGLFILDEPESALSPKRQVELLRILQEAEGPGGAQIIIATHSPIIMAYPTADVLELTRDGLRKTTVEGTEHFRILKEFCADPREFAAERLARE